MNPWRQLVATLYTPNYSLRNFHIPSFLSPVRWGTWSSSGRDHQWDTGVTCKSDKTVSSCKIRLFWHGCLPNDYTLIQRIWERQGEDIDGGDECKVKIYPCLVHVLFRGQLHKYDAKAMPGLIKQMTAAQDLIKEVTTTKAQKYSE